VKEVNIEVSALLGVEGELLFDFKGNGANEECAHFVIRSGVYDDRLTIFDEMQRGMQILWKIGLSNGFEPESHINVNFLLVVIIL
jgi:hypothetical protein